MDATLRLSLEKARELPAPQFRTAPGSLTLAGRPRRVVRHDRRRARPVRQRAERGAGDDRPHHRRCTGCRAEDAYLLCSLCVDLKISEVVDAGEWIVSALLPEVVLRQARDRRDGRGVAPPRGLRPAVERLRAVAGAERAAAGVLRADRERRLAGLRRELLPRVLRPPRLRAVRPRAVRAHRRRPARLRAVPGRHLGRRREHGLAAGGVAHARARRRAARGVGAGRGAVRRERGDELLVRGLDDRLVRPDAAGGAAGRAGSAAGQLLPALRRRGAAAPALHAAGRRGRAGAGLRGRRRGGAGVRGDGAARGRDHGGGLDRLPGRARRRDGAHRAAASRASPSSRRAGR